MIRIAIIEDNFADAELLIRHIEKFSKEESVEMSYRYFKDGMQFLEAFKQDYDAVLLDIEMPVMNGMETAHKLRKLNADIPLIFITNMAQYAIKGYEVDAMGYFIKPIRYMDFYNRFKKVVFLVRSQRSSVMIKAENQIVKLTVSDIRYLDVDNIYVTFHTGKGDYRARMTLTAAEAQLKESGCFTRCNNCYLVNLAYVTAIHGNMVTVDGTDLLISRHKKKDFINALTAYFGGQK